MRAKKVTIKGVCYDVKGSMRTTSRSLPEYLLALEGTKLIVKLCHAAPCMVKQAIVCGQLISYEY